MHMKMELHFNGLDEGHDDTMNPPSITKNFKQWNQHVQEAFWNHRECGPIMISLTTISKEMF
jgi:hypothetical protein